MRCSVLYFLKKGSAEIQRQSVGPVSCDKYEETDWENLLLCHHQIFQQFLLLIFPNLHKGFSRTLVLLVSNIPEKKVETELNHYPGQVITQVH